MKHAGSNEDEGAERWRAGDDHPGCFAGLWAGHVLRGGEARAQISLVVKRAKVLGPPGSG
jgi:hypothetical protein